MTLNTLKLQILEELPIDKRTDTHPFFQCSSILDDRFKEIGVFYTPVYAEEPGQKWFVPTRFRKTYLKSEWHQMSADIPSKKCSLRYRVKIKQGESRQEHFEKCVDQLIDYIAKIELAENVTDLPKTLQRRIKHR